MQRKSFTCTERRGSSSALPGGASCRDPSEDLGVHELQGELHSEASVSEVERALCCSFELDLSKTSKHNACEISNHKESNATKRICAQKSSPCTRMRHRRDPPYAIDSVANDFWKTH